MVVLPAPDAPMRASSRPASHRPLTPCKMVSRLLPRRFGLTVYTRSANSSTYVPEDAFPALDVTLQGEGGWVPSMPAPVLHKDCSSMRAAIKPKSGRRRSVLLFPAI